MAKETIGDGIKLKGSLILKHTCAKTGKVTVTIRHNTVTTAGKEHWADQMSSSPGQTAISKMEIGEGTGGTTTLNALIATWGTENLTSRTDSGAVVTYVATFTGGGTKTVTEAGLLNSTDVLTNYVDDLSQLMNLSDTIQITWNTTVG